ncbi:efflux RND transporter permease subunit [Vibrio maerlii]|uniref:efflux RND transporter permease subunit n=1 Tax=Vibrio maerlii TaxID=2231648 RepID=UPI000E3CA6EC|nr:efflux RND transporter permease subunit [Vibrio maerlii]
MNLIAYFAQRPFLARIITIMVLMVGAGSLMTLKLQEYPNVAFENATIETIYPGATAQDIELNITNPIEKELRSVQGINFYQSQSTDGRSLIEVEFLASADAAKVMRDLQQAIDRVTGLPKGINNPPVLTQEDTSSFGAYGFGVHLTESNSEPSELQHYAYELEKKVKALPGVSTVTMSGYRDREFWVEIDPLKVSRYQLTFDEIGLAIQQRNLSESGGIVESWITEQKIVTMTQVSSAEEIEAIVIKALPSGSVIRVSDVATVHDTFAKATEQGVINGESSVLFKINNSSGADIVSTVSSIQALLESENQRLGGKFGFQSGFNLANDMVDKFSIVSVNGGIGLVLVLLVLSLILKRQVAFWVSVSIPFCILGVMIVLSASGLNLDSITLAALLLVIGIIVDDSVIVAESIYQEKERGKTGIEAAISGTQKVIKPIIASLTTTALVFIPMAFIPGAMGKVVVVIPVTVIAALLFSLAECTFTLPAHLSKSMAAKNTPQDKPDRFEAIIKAYQKLLTRCLHFKKSVIVIALLVASVSVGLVTTLKVDIFPSEAAKYVKIYTEVQPGTPVERVRESHQALEQALATLPEHELVSYEIAYASPVSEGTITLTNYELRERTADDIIAAIKDSMGEQPEEVFIKLSVDAGGPPPGEPIELRVLGGSDEERQHAVTLVSEWFEQHPGLHSVNHSEALKDPQVSVIPQYDWLAKYGLTVSDLTSTLRLAFEGDTVSSSWLGDQDVEIRVIMDDQYRDIQRLATTKIYTPQGKQVPLSRLAKVETIEAPRLIKHYNGVREVTVTAQIADEALSSTALSEQVLNELAGQYAPSITLDVGGEAENTDETLSGFMVAFPAALLAIYFVLAVMFNSMLQPLLVMSVIPFAVISALMALVVHMQALSMFALIGVLGMTGVVVNNSLVLINRINELRSEGSNVLDAVTEASVSRLRPIVLTSLTTVVGLLPLAYGLGGTDVYMGPMSLTLGYGLLFSLPVVLIVVPCLYAFTNRDKPKS